jgi:PIN domain nuclease of toxin-antitoxin system
MSAYLLDTHVLLGIFRLTDYEIPETLFPPLSSDVPKFASATSMWEVAIKARSGKLRLRIAPSDLPDLCEKFAIGQIDITVADALHELETSPPTRDPFDRLLLAQCAVRGWRLLTTDDDLVHHPVAWR